MNIYAVLMLIWLMPLSTGLSSQGKCSEGFPPEIRGLKIGMTTQDLTQKIKGVRVRAADELGERAISIRVSPADLSMRDGVVNLDDESIVSTRTFPELKGIVRIELAFIDDRVYQVAVAYQTPPQWRNVDEFTVQLSTSFGLPISSWEDDQNGVREIQCGRFQIRAKIDPVPVIRIFDPSAPIILAARKVEREEKKRGAFKP